MKHDPVMMDEVLKALALKAGQIYLDGTLGLAGHALRMLQELGPEGILIGLDHDETMLAEAKNRLAGLPQKMHLLHADFRQVPEVLADLKLKPHGMLFDLGLNLAQITDASRGMSFATDGPLDMRQDRSQGEPAAALLNRMSPNEIEKALWELGDERWARAIAQKIVARRKEKPLRTTTDLVDCVLAAIPVGARDKRIHPATRTFQAVRMMTNGDLDELEEAIIESAQHLAAEGTLVILSFHSGEDRVVKSAFRSLAGEEFEELYKKPLTPTQAEIDSNPRSRSTKLRAIRRKAV